MSTNLQNGCESHAGRGVYREPGRGRLLSGCRAVLLVLAVSAAALPTAVRADCPSELTSYWHFDETAPGTFADAMGTSPGGCALTGVCPTAAAGGKIYGAQAFSRSLLTGVDAAGAGFNWAAGDSFSIEFWMKKDSSCSGGATTNNEVIVGRDGNGVHWWVGVNCRSEDGQGLIKFNLREPGGNGEQVFSTRQVTDGRWHHVVAVRDGVLGENRIYVDGVLEGTAPCTYTAGFDAGSAPLCIGWLNLTGGYHYTGLIDEVAVYHRALTETEIRGHYFLARDYCQMCQTVRIMPLGDSITKGSTGENFSDEFWKISYRCGLYHLLTGGGYDFDFVGSEAHGWTSTHCLFDDYDHEGHGGYTDAQIAGNVISYLTANPADVILLHIGTNQLDTSPADVENILNNIDAYDEDITVVLARIINHKTYSATVTQFNDNVEAMALARVANQADKIIMVDMEDGAGINYPVDMYDTIHPRQQGYDKMPPVWMAALESFLPVCVPTSPTAPLITSTPITSGFAGYVYAYDVEAVGNPTPTFSLTQHPAGMTIDPVTGLITWIASAPDSYNVTVVASNGVLPDAQQSFTIHVTEAPPCPPELVAYWRLDETSGPTYVDSVGTHDASCAGGDCPDANAAGQVGGCQDFNGVDDDLVTGTATNPTSAITVMAWIHPDALSGGDKGIVYKEGAFGLELESSTNWWIDFWVIANGTLLEYAPNGPGVPIGTWTHVAGTYDGTVLKAYVNGVQVPGQMSLVGTIDATLNPYHIGYSFYPVSGGEHRYFNGKIDEAAVFDRALSEAEILALYQNGLAGMGYCEEPDMAPVITSTPVTVALAGQPYVYDVEATGSPAPSFSLTQHPTGMTIHPVTGLMEWTAGPPDQYDVTVRAANGVLPDAFQSFTIYVSAGSPCPESMIAYWDLDETSGPFADLIGGLDATCESGACPVASPSGRVGGCLDFDGINDVISTAVTTNPTTALTVMAWFRAEDLSQTSPDECILSKKYVFELTIEENGDYISWVILDGQGDSSGHYDEYEPRIPANKVTAGVWTHVAATFDGTTQAIYLNGALVGTDPAAFSALGNANGYQIGWSAHSAWDGGLRYFNGQIDEVAIFDVALTQPEIQALYERGLAGEPYCGGTTDCGNGICDAGEDSSNCPADCYCGNGTCDVDEDPTTCPADCPCHAWHVLPESYCPGVEAEICVTIEATGVSAVGVEHAPPAGWTDITNISHGGSYDAVNHKVKWGPFFSPSIPALLCYDLTPPPGADGLQCFEGEVSLSGTDEPICGDACFDLSCCPFMQADRPQNPCAGCADCSCGTCEDGRIELCEMIGYACAWKKGCNDDLAGMTRAAFLWKTGECYCWDDIQQNWFGTPCPAPISGCCPTSLRAAGEDPGAWDTVRIRPGAAAAAVSKNLLPSLGAGHTLPILAVPIEITAPADASAAGLELSVPQGWAVLKISDGGQWDEVYRKVKWGPFLDNLSRTVTVSMQPVTPSALYLGFAGTVSFDGTNHDVGLDALARVLESLRVVQRSQPIRPTLRRAGR